MKFRFLGALLACLCTTSAYAFEVSSPDIGPEGVLKSAQVANMLGCSGENLSPALSWKDPPAGTRSFAISVYDPDAPTGSGWWHWTVFNIPASVSSLPAGAGAENGKALPRGAVQGRNDGGISAFMGACPPPGPAHRYIITVSALKVEKLDLPKGTSGAMAGFMTKANTIATAEIIATYGR